MGVLVTAVRTQHDERDGGVEYVVALEPTASTWVRLAEDLRRGEVLGAALLTDSTSAQLGLAGECPGRLVVDRARQSATEELLAVGWIPERLNDALLVFAPPPRRVEPEQPPTHPRSREPDQAPAVQLVEREQFAAGIDGTEPMATEIDSATVELDDQRMFGDFTASRLGGSSALLSLSGAGKQPGTLLLRNPAALGLARADDQADSLSAQTRSSSVRCAAVGLSQSFQRGEWPGLEDPAGVAALWRSVGPHNQGFWLVLELSAPNVDPPVWIPAGQIFEQRARTGRQTLASTIGVGTVVSPGQLTVLLTPAYCLDRHLGPPAGDPMGITPFRLPLTPGTTQARVWQERDAAKGELG
jgi:hypothetical protein